MFEEEEKLLWEQIKSIKLWIFVVQTLRWNGILRIVLPTVFDKDLNQMSTVVYIEASKIAFGFDHWLIVSGVRLK